jgi:hypothetical protein
MGVQRVEKSTKLVGRPDAHFRRSLCSRRVSLNGRISLQQSSSNRIFKRAAKHTVRKPHGPRGETALAVSPAALQEFVITPIDLICRELAQLRPTKTRYELCLDRHAVAVDGALA